MRFQWTAAACAASLIQCSVGSSIEERASSPSATIKQGTVVGTTTVLSGASAAATKYLSIPVAQSPPLRFAPPSAPAPFTKPYQATQKKDACLQQFSASSNPSETKRIFNNPGGPAPTESEDCLYLDVYVPPGTKPSDKKAVMFWLYGGNLQFGTKNLMFYDGSSFATNQDVIVVVPNYRTNVFGFPNSPEIPAKTQNAGLLDQRMALKWVYDNIAAFGGNANRVTIFGESAGAYSVKQLMAIPPSPKQFSAAILESQGASTTGNGTMSWNQLAQGLNCASAASPLKCLRGKDGRAIQSYIVNNSLAFPLVANEITATADIKSRIEKGTFAKVPFIIGTNANEGRVFAYLAGLDQPGANITKFLENELGPLGALLKPIINELEPLFQSPYFLVSALLTNLLFQCPTMNIAKLAQENGYDVWRYIFNGTFPNVSTFPDAGAYHSVEIPEVFGTYEPTNELGKATPAQIELSKYMQNSWANLAKNAAPGNGWNPYGSSGNVQVLGFPKRGGGNPTPSAKVDQLCTLLAPITGNLYR